MKDRIPFVVEEILETVGLEHLESQLPAELAQEWLEKRKGLCKIDQEFLLGKEKLKEAPLIKLGSHRV